MCQEGTLRVVCGREAHWYPFIKSLENLNQIISVIYDDLVAQERCDCYCCTQCASKCDCGGGEEGEDEQVWRVLQLDGEDDRVQEAEKSRQQFVTESRIKFADEDVGEDEDEEEEEEEEERVAYEYLESDA